MIIAKLKFKFKNLLSKILYRIDALKESRRLGVKIGHSCRLVGAGSIVKGHIEKDSVYAGVPARRIKSLTDYKLDIKDNIIDTKNLSPKSKKDYLKNFFRI